MNQNEITNLEVELTVEEAEAVISPGPIIQHNETVEVELAVEEAEAVIAPGLSINHNETLAIEC